MKKGEKNKDYNLPIIKNIQNTRYYVKYTKLKMAVIFGKSGKRDAICLLNRWGFNG